jgi:hypothetical protein
MQVTTGASRPNGKGAPRAQTFHLASHLLRVPRHTKSLLRACATSLFAVASSRSARVPACRSPLNTDRIPNRKKGTSVLSGSVQRGLSAIRPMSLRSRRDAAVRPDGGKTLYC